MDCPEVYLAYSRIRTGQLVMNFDTGLSFHNEESFDHYRERNKDSVAVFTDENGEKVFALRVKHKALLQWEDYFTIDAYLDPGDVLLSSDGEHYAGMTQKENAMRDWHRSTRSGREICSMSLPPDEQKRAIQKFEVTAADLTEEDRADIQAHYRDLERLRYAYAGEIAKQIVAYHVSMTNDFQEDRLRKVLSGVLECDEDQHIVSWALAWCFENIDEMPDLYERIADERSPAFKAVTNWVLLVMDHLRDERRDMKPEEFAVKIRAISNNQPEILKQMAKRYGDDELATPRLPSFPKRKKRQIGFDFDDY